MKNYKTQNNYCWIHYFKRTKLLRIISNLFL